jgi:hypothetical protein
MPIMFVGFITMAAGLVLKADWATKAGLVACLSGLLLCGAGNAIPLGWSFAVTLRESGVRGLLQDLRAQPRGWVLLLAVFLLYSILGVGGAVLILAALGVFK